MKKHLLTLLLAVFAVTVMAQTTPETALELKGGANEYEPTTTGYTYWKYTAEENVLVKFTGLSGVSACKLDDSGAEVTLNGVSSYSDPYPFYLPVGEGETVYFKAYVYQPVTFEAAINPYANYGKGLSEDNPAVITVGEDLFLGATESTGGYNEQKMYATYTAGEDGVLELTSLAYVSSATVNGASASFEYGTNGNYVLKLAVTNGETYNLVIGSYSPVALTSEMTHPEPGTLDNPFKIVDGENTLPAALGDYYYVFTNTKTGYGVISSTASLPGGGQVKVYRGKQNITYQSPCAFSSTGSFDVRFEMPTVGETYYICVSKLEATVEADIFTFTEEAYAPGDKEDNPIKLDVPSTGNVTKAGVTDYYYSVTVPAGVHQFLCVEATSEVTNPNTIVTVYPKGGSRYSGTSGNGSVRAVVDGGENGQDYMVVWTSYETGSVTFDVSYEDIKQGDVITDPIPAVVGENTISGDGTKYYTYTATLTGKMVIKGVPGMTVSFPRGTGQYDGNYTPIVVGTDYTLDITEGTAYLIKIDGDNDGKSFTLEESEYEVGESSSNPIIVENGQFTLEDKVYSNLWLKYTAERSGVLVISSDVTVNSGDNMFYGTDPVYGMQSMITSAIGTEGSTQSYEATTPVAEGDVYFVNLKLTNAYEGSVVTFTIRDAEPGETVDNPIELVAGQEVSIPAPSNDKPVWCKAKLTEGSVEIKSDNYLGGYYYESKESAEAGGYGNYFYISNYDSSYNPLDYYLWTGNITVAGDYYFKFEQGTAATLTLGGTATSIKDATVDNSTVSVSGGNINVNADNADVKVYTVSGAMVVNEKVSGSASFSLEPGIYIVKINDTVKKVSVR